MKILEQLNDIIANIMGLSDTRTGDARTGSEFVVPSDSSHGDFTTNAAMQHFRDLTAEQKQQYKSPRGYADALVAQLKENADFGQLVADCAVAGPGFINITLQPETWWKLMQTMYADGVAQHVRDNISTENKAWQGKKVLVEFTDPNPFKELHIGHAYSNVVGESLARLFEQTGATVLRVCYQGDVGMHVAKSVWGMQELLKARGQRLEDIAALPVSERVQFLGQSYATGATAYEAEDAQEAVKQAIKDINFVTFAAAQQQLIITEGWQPQVDYSQFLENSSVDVATISALYAAGRAWSLEYFDTQYKRLGMQFDDFFFESITGEYGLKIVREFLPKGIFRESQGAIIFPGSEYGLHDRVFVNSLGLPTYEAKELGLAPEKYRRHQYDYSIIITGNEINDYFKVLLMAIKQTHPELAAKTKHISHGMVRLPEGKMSSRTGKVLTAEWLLDKAQEQVATMMQETRPEWSDAERASLAAPIGIGAIKYAFLKQGIGGDIAFSFDESLSFTGQSGPYLQYSIVRCRGILEKANQADTVNIETQLGQTSSLPMAETQAWNLLKLCLLYPMKVDQAITDLAPQVIATYLFTLAQAFSSFYDSSVVLQEADDSVRASKLALVHLTEHILQHGLQLLGVETVERM